MKDLLALKGIDYVDTSQGYRPDGSTRVTAGLSDLIVMRGGQVTFVEMKTPEGRQTRAQVAFQATCERNDVEYLVWRSVEDCRAWVEGG